MTDGETCSCKVGRVAERYELPSLDDELRRRYAGDASLRDLERLVNERVLRTAIDRADGDVSTLVTSDWSVEALYGILRDEGETAPGERTRVRTRLEQAGVDVSAVTDDWVSHATIRTHLNDCLSVETSREASITPEEAINTVEWARSRSENVVGETVRRLNAADVIDIAEPTAGVSIRITCEACGRSFTLPELVESGGCDCGED